MGAFYEVLGEFEEELPPGVVRQAAEGVIRFEAELAGEFLGAGEGAASFENFAHFVELSVGQAGVAEAVEEEALIGAIGGVEGAADEDGGLGAADVGADRFAPFGRIGIDA